MKAAQGVISDVTSYLCQTPVKGKEGKKHLCQILSNEALSNVAPTLILRLVFF